MPWRLVLLCAVVWSACAPEPVPPPEYPDKAVAPNERESEESRPLAVEKPENPGASRAPEEHTDLGKAPAGTWTSSSGASVDVTSLTEGRGAIVVFYRGFWCKFCRKQLEELEAAKDDFAGRGFAIHAISTDSPEKSEELKKRLGITFELYSDVGGFATRAWGVYSREHDLARPAVFVIAPGGEITYRYVSDTPADRPSVEKLLDLAKKARPTEENKP